MKNSTIGKKKLRNDIAVLDCYKNNGIIITIWSIERIIMSIMIQFLGKFGIA